MSGWRIARLFFLGALAPLFLAAFAAAQEPKPLSPLFESKAQPLAARPLAVSEKPTAAQLRERAARAEKTGDWEAAFSAYCELSIADRGAADVRGKVNAALRRVQQLRRHRDPGFQQFVGGLAAADAVNLFAEVASKVPTLFADPARATPQKLWNHGIEELHRALGNPGFRQAFLDNAPVAEVEAFRTQLRTAWAKRKIATARDARTHLKQLLAAAHDAFAIRVPAALAIEFVCGACSGLDEYTVFLTPTQLAEPPEPTFDLSAYGILLHFENGELLVEGVLPGSWAAFQPQQIRKGDRIVRINGQGMDMAGPDQLSAALRMPVNGLHELTVAMGESLMVVRLPISLPTVWHRIVGSKEGIGHIRISEFQATTARDVDLALAALKAQDVRAILLDLRGNRGGSFVAAVEVAKRFLPSGVIVTTQGQLGEVANRVFSSDFGMRAMDVPVVVLIDSETASAAEVVAAALRDNHQRSERTVLVGMPTFGKGTIQYPLKLAAADNPDDRGKPRGKSGTVRLTIARLVAPNGKPINGAGITPEYLVSDPARQWEVAFERAVEILQSASTPAPLLPPSQ